MLTPKKSILFVCLGNICRSPTGEGVFQTLVDERGLSQQIHVDSAGTIGFHQGNAADSRMRKSAARRGYDLTSRSRKITTGDLNKFDLIIAMDRQNFVDIESLSGQQNVVRKATLKLLSDFLDDDENWPIDVPDPYYGGDAGFETVLDMIEAACPAILEALLEP